MNVLLAGDLPADDWARWQAALAGAMPEARFLAPDDARRVAGEVQAAVVANPLPGLLSGWPALRLIQSLWAGVDRLLGDPTLPAGVPLARMVDPAMTAAMAETAAWAVLSLHRGFFAYQRRQHEGRWQVHGQRQAAEVAVLVLGQGEMGRRAAGVLAGLGYRVSGWSRRLPAVPLPGVRPLAGDDALRAALPAHELVVNLLPLTPATAGLMDRHFLSALPAGAALVNLARGAHVVEDDLLAALDSGRLRHAVLDVYRQEPLPPGHRFWRHPRVTMLPHAAALTDPRTAAAVVAANLRSLRDGGPIAHRVERGQGY